MDSPSGKAKNAVLWAIMISITVISLLALNAIVNVIARHYWMQGESRQWTEYDRTLGWRHKTNLSFRTKFPEARSGYVYYELNNLGFRETTDTPETSARDHRILVFGDSHTEGHVDTPQTIPNIAEQALNNLALDAEVINAGVGRYSLYQERLLFEEMLYLSPDAVVFILFVGNDYFDMLPWPTGAPKLSLDLEGEIQIHPVPPPPKKTADDFLAKYSWFLQHSLRRIRRIRAKLSEDESTFDLYEQLMTKLDYGVVGQGMVQAAFFKQNPDRFQESSRLHSHVARDIARIAAENDIELLFVVLPNKYQIERETFAAGFELAEQTIGLDPENKLEDRIREDFRRILDEEEISFLDPYDQLILDERQLYWTAGHHLNTEGCALVGELLAEELRKKIVRRAETHPR